MCNQVPIVLLTNLPSSERHVHVWLESNFKHFIVDDGNTSATHAQKVWQTTEKWTLRVNFMQTSQKTMYSKTPAWR